MNHSSLNSITFSLLISGGIALGAFAQQPNIGPQKRLDPGGGTAAANETTVSASEFNPNVIVAGWNDWRRSGGSEVINAGFSLSFDGGDTWADLLVRPPVGFQTNVEGDPMSAFDDRTGTLWAGAIAFGGSHLYVARLDPGDTTFQPSVVAESGGLDKCWMAAGPQPGNPNSTRVYIALNVGLLWSDDMGDSWTNPRALGSGIGWLPRIGPNGEVYIAYWDLNSGMMMKRSLDGGTTLTTHRIATRMDTWGTQDGSRFPGRFRVPSMVYIDVSQTTGKLYAVYFDTTNSQGGNRNVDLYFTTSTDQGTTWEVPRVINTDNEPAGDQFFSWIELDERDRIHIVFLDSRHTAQNDDVIDGMFDAYYMFSSDDGTTWSEHRLTPDSWNSNNDGLNRSGQFLGDYLGLATAGNRIYPVYLDTHTGDTNIYTNVVTFGSTALLSGFEVVRGTLVRGELTDLQESDQSRVRMTSAPGPTLSELHATDIVVHANIRGDSASSISVTVESRVLEPVGIAKVALRNWNSGKFETIGSFPVEFADTTETVFTDTVENYVSDNGRIDVSIKHIVFAPFISFQFDSAIDLVEIAVSD